MIEQIDADENSSTVVYDARGRQISATDRLTETTAWTYDLAGNEESMTDPESQTTTYAYDDAGRRFKTTWPDHTAMTSPGDAGYGITETVYDEAGRILRQIDQNGDTVTRLYDLAGRMTSRVYRTRANSPTGTIADTDTFTYDDVGRMLTAVSGRYSNTITLAYDEGGRKESESLTYAGQSYTILYAYDDAGRPETRTLPDGTVENLTFTATGRPDTVTVGMTTLVDFGYDDGGRETSRTFGNSLVMNKTYRLDNSLDTVGTSGVVSLDYDYDATGNVIEEDRTGLLSTLGYTADYDDADRMTDWIRDNSDTQTWDLSPVGNWDTTTINSVPETRTHGPAHELTARGMAPLTYDVKGNLTSDTTGKLLAWDFDNKLRSVDTDADTLADVEYAYDALGRRIEQTNYSGMGEGRTSTSRVYVLSGQQVVAEYARSSAANSPLYRYTHSGLYIDDKVCRWQPGGESGTYHYYHHNRQFSTVAITDANGDPVECYAYTPYGTVLIADETGTPIGASAHDHRYLYTGRDWDVQSGLWYFRARYMDPVLGRFIGRDPLEYVDGGSTYGAYFVPTNIDPSGEQGHKIQRYCGGKWYMDDVRYPDKGCCNGKLYDVATHQCCNGAIVDSRPKWKVAGFADHQSCVQDCLWNTTNGSIHSTYFCTGSGGLVGGAIPYIVIGTNPHFLIVPCATLLGGCVGQQIRIDYCEAMCSSNSGCK